MTVTSQTYTHGVDWESTYGMSQGFRAGDTVYISGQLSHDENAELIGEGDIAKQLEVTFEHLDQVLAGFGATRSQIVEDTILVVGVQENFAAISAAHSAYLGEHRPASTLLGVTELSLPGQLVEIAAVVRLDLPK